MTRPPMAPVAGLSRTSSLPSPPPRPAKRAVPTEESPRPAPSPGPAPEPAAKAEPTRPRRAGRESADTVRPVTVSLPASLVQGVRDRSRIDGVSQPEVLMDALVATQSRLEELVTSEPAHQTTRSDGLFIRRESGPRRDEPLATLTVRMLSRNVDTIDALVEKIGAPSRSALCAAALRDYLAGHAHRD